MNIYKLIIALSITINIAYGLPTQRETPKINFLALADVHFDPFISCENNKCALIEKLRKNPVTEWPQLLAKYDVKPPQFHEDTNFTLLTSSLAAAKNAANDYKVQFVLMLGDSLGHEFRAKYLQYSGDDSIAGFQSFTRKTLSFMTQQLAAAFPTTDVYTIVGNNDSYQGDYLSTPDGSFFKDAAKLWASLIKNPANAFTMQTQFTHAGYYSILLPNAENIRLIALNSNLFSYKAKGRNIDKAANEELNWLHAQLQTARTHHENVFIAMHIPEGIDVYATLRMRLFRVMALWKLQYIQRFQTELSQFAPEIMGIFAGHLHMDWYQIITFNDAAEVPLLGVTSISPIFGNNPGFKVCSFSTDPVSLDDFVTYVYPINGSQTWGVKSHFK